MIEQNDLEQAKDVFNALCQALDKHEWPYKKDENKLSIECRARGEDLPMDFTVIVDPDRMIAILISDIPFVIQEDKRIDVAVAVSAINNILVDGSFDYNIVSGYIFFRMTNCFIECKISEKVFEYMLYRSFQMIDKYNDKLLMLDKGMISIEQFLSTLAN